MRTAPILPERMRAGGLLQALGSPRLALALLPALGVTVVAVGRVPDVASSWLAVPLAALAANLAACIATRPAFRAQPWLLAFHAALLVVVAVAAGGRLTYLQGTIELSQGEEFDGTLLQSQRGPLHADGIAGVRFTNVDFVVAFDPGFRRGRTTNRIAWTDGEGRIVDGEIGDDAPLRLAGYRIYTTSNKGFAPDFTWDPDSGSAVRGTLHLPSYPAQLAEQRSTWTPSGAVAPVRVLLRIDDRLADPEASWRLRVPDRHHVVVETDGVRAELRPGDSVRLPQGTLRYEGLRLWMGYLVSHDPTQPWLLAACLVAAASLAMHFVARFRAASWRLPDGGS